MTEEDLILLIACGSMIIWCFSFLLFTRTSMKTIERKMLDEGIDIPWWDEKGWGLRISTFVSVLARGKQSKIPVLADEAILRHARTYDRVLARVVSYSFIIFMLVSIYIVYMADL
ncbi:hypothetical protein Q4601_14345 [Shewanella sp. 1_MG-2023]|uniref:hypothetical protein n=1 Tax=unclassified Shewanella TaxID=196818 RepID=UPI0026E2100E|nr:MULTISPECIES: hypothetical protein [unclassified Shewanella]MDO6611389.1 hypothetical protein [Shewanella sp. 7_MG-2023]MDO6771244.1 hypothetical protein [Shewanella sp. 2_MG-2023]MDO6795485.1 hypothetical protein [Shewanella sp. 1_MG-2023]